MNRLLDRHRQDSTQPLLQVQCLPATEDICLFMQIFVEECNALNLHRVLKITRLWSEEKMLTWNPWGYLKATGTLTRLGSGEPDGWNTRTASLVVSSKLKYCPEYFFQFWFLWRFSIHSQINSLTLAVESLRIDPGKELGPVPVETGLDGGAVVVVVVLKVPQPVAVPRPVTIELVCPVVPGESPSLKKFSLFENKERLLADLIGKIKTTVSSLCDKTSDAKSLNLAPPLIFGLKLIWGNVECSHRKS